MLKKDHFPSRYVCWSAYLLKKPPKVQSALGGEAGAYTAKLALDQKIYFQYFVQDDTESGTLMDTKIPLKEVSLVSGLSMNSCNSM